MSDFSLVHRSAPARAGSPPYPGLIMLHGLGSNEADLLSLTPYLDPRVYAISVRAPLPYSGGGFMWYDLERDGFGLGSDGIERSISMLQGFLAEAVNQYKLDPSRLYVAGFSMGAAMAGALQLLDPRAVAGAIMTSGYLPPGDVTRYRLEEAAGRPIFQAHGTFDPVVPLDAAHRTRDFLSGTKVDLTYREYPIGHTISPDELNDLVRWLSDVLDRADTARQQ